MGFEGWVRVHSKTFRVVLFSSTVSNHQNDRSFWAGKVRFCFQPIILVSIILVSETFRHPKWPIILLNFLFPLRSDHFGDFYFSTGRRSFSGDHFRHNGHFPPIISNIRLWFVDRFATLQKNSSTPELVPPNTVNKSAPGGPSHSPPHRDGIDSVMACSKF